MNIGDKVKKIGGDYSFVGVIVAHFTKLSGAIRFVVEDDGGILHIFSERNLELSNAIETEIKIGQDGRCMCSCADPCPLGHVGSAARCWRAELESAGIKTV